MEGRYTENHAICGVTGQSLHYPDFDLFEKQSEPIGRKRTKKRGKTQRICRTFGKCRKSRRKGIVSSHAIAFYRKRLLQLLFIAIMLTFVFGSIGVHADPIETECEKDELLYKVITVERGDTLWDIADIWFESTGDSIRTYIDNIKIMNHLHGDQIQEGQLLMIYYGNGMDDIVASDGM